MLILKIAILFFFSFLAAYQDLKKREISDSLIFSFLTLSLFVLLLPFLLSLKYNTFFSQINYFVDYITPNIIFALLVFFVGYVFYKKGYLGGGDIKFFSIIALLLPFYNSNFLVLNLLFASLLLLPFYLLPCFLKYLKKKRFQAIKENKINLFQSLFLLILILILFFVYPLPPFVPSNLLLFLLLLFAVFYSAFEKGVRKFCFLKKIKISDLDTEEIVEPSNLPKEFQKYLLFKKDFKKLQKKGFKYLKVYRNLPPLLYLLFFAEILVILLNFPF